MCFLGNFTKKKDLCKEKKKMPNHKFGAAKYNPVIDDNADPKVEHPDEVGGFALFAQGFIPVLLSLPVRSRLS